MRIKSLLQAAALSTTVFLCAFPALAQAQDTNSQQTGDPIADAARRSREAKQNAAKPHKVYTDDDVSKPKPAPATDASGTAAPSAGAAANATKTPADQDAKAEASWRKRFQDQRDKIALAEKELDILQRESQKAQVQYYPDPQKAMTEQYTRKDINDKDAKIVAKQQEIAQLKQGLSDLEDELRKSGGDPGWAR
jgi:chromosome segregation ATPase